MSDQRAVSRRTRRSFLTGGIAAAAGLGAFEWLRTRRQDDGVYWPLRIGLEADEGFWRDFNNPARLAATFPPADAETPRVNGKIGIADDIDPNWNLTVGGVAGADEPLVLSLADITSLPKVEMITELKCIEGWRHIVKWGGARFRDFAAKYAPANTDPNTYVALETPGGGYYVGLELPSMLHPQTLLCYEMNDQPLEPDHGGPLRLVAPIKYGIKNLKRIGRIAFSGARPPDYWAEQGYDYYSGF